MHIESLAEHRSHTLAPKTTDQSVCAVLVTYHPDAAMLEHLHHVLAQVHGLVVVDNGSNPDELGVLRAAGRDCGFHLIENGRNVGIAEALNRGIAWVKSQNFPWVLLLDQDSRTGDGFVAAMLGTWLSHPKREQIASIYPRYIHPKLGYTQMAPIAVDGTLIWCLTSGTLIPTWIFDKIGWFASNFFIDWVDVEYCFRIRAAGYQIVESPEAILLHDPGQSAPASFLGLRFWPSHHSPVRRYYMSRNRVVVFRKYFLRLPVYTLKAMSMALRDSAKCFLGEKERQRKFRNFLLGSWDGLIGRMGSREGL
jgi:rhamnosyltransferase